MHWSDKLQNDDRAVVVNVDTPAEVLSDMESRLLSNGGFSVATLNLDHVVKLRHMPQFREAYLKQTHVTADGNPIVWLARLSGQKISLTPGSELIDPVVAMAARNNFPIAFFGSQDSVLADAGTALEQQYDGLVVASRIAPPMGFDPTSAEADALIEEIGASGARICFLALGAPKQEIFAARAHARLPHVGFLSIGAGLDFIAGHQKRAPKFVRKIAAEWLWRLLNNPKRLIGRYGSCLAILPGLTLQALRVRFANTDRPLG